MSPQWTDGHTEGGDACNGILSSLKRKGMLTHDAVWMSLEDAMLREANTRGPALHGVPLAGGTQRSRTRRQGAEGRWPGAGGGEIGVSVHWAQSSRLGMGRIKVSEDG